MRHYIICIFLLTAIGTQAQQINPVPDYVFRNQMSVGRNAVTDTAAYISIGPRYGANKGLMPPIVSDTAAITGVKRNGLLIFSVQRNNFQYWDSINSRWTSVTANVDTTVISTRAWRKKGDDSLGAVIATKVNISDTATMLNPYTRGSGTTNYVPKFTGTRTFGNSALFDNGNDLGYNTTTFNSTAGYSSVAIGNTSGGFIELQRANVVGLRLYTDFGESGVIERRSANLLFGTNAAERMRIFANGRVGVNTTTDAGYQFDINGTLRSVNGANFATSSGNVGIGTASASAKLENYTSVGTKPTLGDATQGYTIISGDSRTGTSLVSSSYATTLILASNRDTIGEGIGASVGFQGKWNSSLYTSQAQFASIFGGKENATDANLAGYLSFATRPAGGNPTERARITSAGELLIGTTTDAGAYALQVAGSIYNTTGAVLAASSGNVGVGTITSAGKVSSIQSGVVAPTNAAYWLSHETSAASTDGLAIGTNGSASYKWIQSYNGALSINSSGNNVLIGTTTDAGERLQVSGTARVTQSAYLATASGAVGIGTTSVNAGRNLQINGNSTDSFIQLVTTTSGTTASDGFVIGVGNGTEAFLLNYENAPIKIFTGGNERMRISATGNVGINTNNPTGLFTILNGIEFFYVGFGANNDNYYTCGTNGIQVFRRGTTETARITSGGNVLIGTTTDTGELLQVNGTIRGVGAVYLATTSGSVGIALTNATISGFRFDVNGTTLLRSNTAIGPSTATFGTSATNTLAIYTGATVPTTSPADAIQMYSADVVAGNAAPHFRTENGAVVKVYQETTAVANPAFTQNAGTAVNDASTFDGYTLAQVVRALKNQGLLA